MTEIEKLAALIIRLIGGLLAARVTLGLLLPQLSAALGGSARSYGGAVLAANLFYLVFAVALVAASKPLGRLFGRGLS